MRRDYYQVNNLNTQFINLPSELSRIECLTASMTSKHIFSPSLSQSNHNIRKSQFLASDARYFFEEINAEFFMTFKYLLLAFLTLDWPLCAQLGM
jgi:hypothetical protein